MKESLDDVVDHYMTGRHQVSSAEVDSAELYELMTGSGKIAVVMPKFLIRHLIMLQTSVELGIGEMIEKAIIQFVDRERSRDTHS